MTIRQELIAKESEGFVQVLGTPSYLVSARPAAAYWEWDQQMHNGRADGRGLLDENTHIVYRRTTTGRLARQLLYGHAVIITLRPDLRYDIGLPEEEITEAARTGKNRGICSEYRVPHWEFIGKGAEKGLFLVQANWKDPRWTDPNNPNAAVHDPLLKYLVEQDIPVPDANRVPRLLAQKLGIGDYDRLVSESREHWKGVFREKGWMGADGKVISASLPPGVGMPDPQFFAEREVGFTIFSPSRDRGEGIREEYRKILGTEAMPGKGGLETSAGNAYLGHFNLVHILYTKRQGRNVLLDPGIDETRFNDTVRLILSLGVDGRRMLSPAVLAELPAEDERHTVRVAMGNSSADILRILENRKTRDIWGDVVSIQQGIPKRLEQVPYNPRMADISGYRGDLASRMEELNEEVGKTMAGGKTPVPMRFTVGFVGADVFNGFMELVDPANPTHEKWIQLFEQQRAGMGKAVPKAEGDRMAAYLKSGGLGVGWLGYYIDPELDPLHDMNWFAGVLRESIHKATLEGVYGGPVGFEVTQADTAEAWS